MSADDFYWYASVLIFIPWGLLILAPKYRYTETIAFVAAVVLLVAAAWFTIQYLTDTEEGGSLLSLEGFNRLFRSEQMLLTGWFNYLSFCLLVGVWQVNDSQREKIPSLFVAPALIMTMITGPAGLLLYLVIRFFKTKSWDIR
jgi:hypothetical protein